MPNLADPCPTSSIRRSHNRDYFCRPRKPLPVHERADHLLEALSKKTEFVGDVVEIQRTQGRQEELLAHCESASYRELEFLLTYSLARLG